jgi:hypothetical protein
MPDHPIYRPTKTEVRLPRPRRWQDDSEQTRETIKASLEILRQPMPDTFLGRKTREPFPKGETDQPA